MMAKRNVDDDTTASPSPRPRLPLPQRALAAVRRLSQMSGASRKQQRTEVRWYTPSPDDQTNWLQHFSIRTWVVYFGVGAMVLFPAGAFAGAATQLDTVLCGHLYNDLGMQEYLEWYCATGA